MRTIEIPEEIYDHICKALTCYEAAERTEQYDPGEALYEDIVDVVNEIEEIMN